MANWECAFNQQMLELSLTEEDVEELRSEKNIKQTKVTNEEIEKLSIDENLSPLQRLSHIMSLGQDIQKISLLAGVPELIASEPSLLPNVLDSIDSGIESTNKDIQLVTIRTLIKLSELQNADLSIIINCFINKVLEMLSGTKKDVVDRLIDLLAVFLPHLSFDTIEKKIFNFLTINGSLTQCPQRRRICCKLISCVAEYVNEDKLESFIIPQMKALCQDIEFDIRSCMCSELLCMFTKMQSIGEKHILPELCLLLQDEETVVRKVALNTIVELLPKLSDELIIKLSIPNLIEKFYRNAISKKSPTDLLIAAKNIGQVVHYLADKFNESDRQLYIDCYQVLCCYGSDGKQSNAKTSTQITGDGPNDQLAECRYWSAFNFPAMLSFTYVSAFDSVLLSLFFLLTKDDHPAVRRTMYTSFHEVLKILQKDSDKILNSIHSSLKETDIDALDGAVTNLHETLHCLHEINKSYAVNLVPFLLLCESNISKSLKWRTHEKFIVNIGCLHKYLSPEIIHDKFIVMMLNILTKEKVIPVKLAAASTLMTFLKSNRNFEERTEICMKLTSDLARSSNSRRRLLFLCICPLITDAFSKSFFKENFYDVAMEMAVDPVTNVRIKFCETLPFLKSQLQLPSDRLMLQMLELSVRRIMALETDPDVSNSIRKVASKLDCVCLNNDGNERGCVGDIDAEKEKDEQAVYEDYVKRKVTGLRCRAYSIPDKIEHPRQKQIVNKEKQRLNIRSTSSGNVLPRKPGPSKSKESLSSVSSKSKDAFTTKSSGSGSMLSTKKSSSPTKRSQKL